MRPKFWFWFSALKFDYQCNAWLTWIILTCSSLTPLVLAFHIGQNLTLRLWGQNFDFDFRPSNLFSLQRLGSLGSYWFAPALRHWFWPFTLAKNQLCDYEAKILILISSLKFDYQCNAWLTWIILTCPSLTPLVLVLHIGQKPTFAILRPEFWFWLSALKIDFKCNAWLTWIILICSSLTPLVLGLHIGQKPTLRLWGQNFDFWFSALKFDYQCNAWLTWIILTCSSLTPLVLAFHIGQNLTLRLWGQNFDFDFRPSKFIFLATLGSLGSYWFAPALRHWFWPYTLTKDQLCDFEAKILILIFGPQIWFSMQRLAHLDHLDLPQSYIGHWFWPYTLAQKPTLPFTLAISRPKFWFWFSALKFDFQCNAWLTWIILTCPSLTPLVLALHIGQKPTLRFWGQNFDFDFRPSKLIFNATLGSLESSWLAPVLRHWFWPYTLAKNQLCDFEAKILILIFGPQNWFSMQRLAHLKHLDLPQSYAIGFGPTHWPKTNFAILRPKFWFWFSALKIDFQCNAWLTWITLTCPSLTPLVFKLFSTFIYGFSVEHDCFSMSLPESYISH